MRFFKRPRLASTADGDFDSYLYHNYVTKHATELAPLLIHVFNTDRDPRVRMKVVERVIKLFEFKELDAVAGNLVGTDTRDRAVIDADWTDYDESHLPGYLKEHPDQLLYIGRVMPYLRELAELLVTALDDADDSVRDKAAWTVYLVHRYYGQSGAIFASALVRFVDRFVAGHEHADVTLTFALGALRGMGAAAKQAIPFLEAMFRRCKDAGDVTMWKSEESDYGTVMYIANWGEWETRGLRRAHADLYYEGTLSDTLTALVPEGEWPRGQKCFR